MKRRHWLGAPLVAVLAFLASSFWSAALAQGRDVLAINSRFQSHIAAGNYIAALADAQLMERLLRTRPGILPRDYAVSLQALGTALEGLGRYREAEKYF